MDLLDWPSALEGKRVLVVNPTRAWWSYVFTGEAALRFNDSGAKTYWLDIPRFLGNRAERLQVNAADKWRAWAYRDPSRRMTKLMRRWGITPIQGVEVGTTPKFSLPSTLSELDALAYEEVAVGAIVRASISGQLFQRYFDAAQHSAEIALQLKIAAELTNAISSLIADLDLDFVATTNDRLLPAAVALATARRDGIKTRVFYWGSDLDSVMVYGTSLYSQDDWRQHVNAAWQLNLGDPATADRAERRLADIAMRPAGTLFTEAMTTGLVPPRTRKRRVVLFPNTPWEFSATEGRRDSITADQLQCFEVFLGALRDLGSDDWEVVVRHHPTHPVLGDRSESSAWQKLRETYDLLEFAADSQIDSYELAQTADLCVVWRSSIGVELMTRGIPTICLDETFWLPSDSPYVCRDQTAITASLKSIPDPPNAQKFAPYVNFQYGWGVPRQYALGTGPSFHLKGRDVFVRRLLTIPLVGLRNFARRIHQRGDRAKLEHAS
jgi:hypothetical protein